YYEEQSGFSYTVDATVKKWLTVPVKAADYGSDAVTVHANKGPKGLRDLWKDAFKAALDSGLAFSQFDQFDHYDVNGDSNQNQ
ncbi:immune inhibitor A domain-containing protein, partial [Bacillus thuringiensis]|uniref:immune inhibitor A domain-containing protein n=1 Tax=Bacillus thuringiensis TaxID=1428 RepID=UPI00284026F3